MESGYNKFLKVLIFSHLWAIIFILLLSMLGMLFAILTPLIMRSLIDDVLIGGNDRLLSLILIGLSGLFVISAISNYFSNYMKGKLENIIFRDLSTQIFGAIHLASLKDLQKIKIGDLQFRTITNANSIAQSVTYIIPDTIVTILGIFLPFFIMMSLNIYLALIVISPIILFAISSWYFGGKIKIYQRPALNSNADMHSFLKSSYSIIPLTKVFGLQNWIFRKFELLVDKFNAASLNVVKITSLNSSANLLILGIPSLLVLSFGSIMVLNGTISLGIFTAFMAYIGLFFSPIQQLSNLWASFKSSQASYDRVEEIGLLKSDRFGDKNFKNSPRKIEFEGVWFSYDDRYVLKNFNATFTCGRNYLIGENGSGKTTVIKLLCRLYLPDRGRILMDNLDLAMINQENFKSLVSIVFADELFVDGTIYENIHIGNLSASREKVIQAAKKSNLHDSVMKLPKRYETDIKEAGLNLSSGEKQKIALARVILRDPPVIVLDEFTRSIDIESKKSIFSVIREMEEKIIIIITHEISDCEDNSNIIYFKKPYTSPECNSKL
jgi:ABC-type bacteriocin/lantibiotic exporter with double-glycine peptidase domain